MAVGDHQGDLDFPLGQRVERRTVLLRLEGLQREALGDLRTDVALPGEDLANRLDHLPQPGALGQVSGGTGLHQAGREGIFLADGDHHDAHVRLAAQQLAGRLEAADARHLQIHQHDIGVQLTGQLQRGLARFGLANDLQALYVGKHAGNTGANQIVIIDHQHLDHSAPRCAKRGNRNVESRNLIRKMHPEPSLKRPSQSSSVKKITQQ
ncbi:hypothetical protein D3C76_1166240 [compost metagenome]